MASFILALCRGSNSTRLPEKEGLEDATTLVDDAGAIAAPKAQRFAQEPDAEPPAVRSADGKLGGGADGKANSAAVDAAQLVADLLAQGGHRYREHGHHEKAVMAYKSALSQRPSNADALVGEVRALCGQGHRQAAGTACASALALHPDDEVLRSLRVRLDDSTTSISELAGVLAAPATADAWPPPPMVGGPVEVNSFAVDVLLQGGHRYFEHRCFQKAVLAYNSALTRHPDNSEALDGRARAQAPELSGKIVSATAAVASADTPETAKAGEAAVVAADATDARPKPVAKKKAASRRGKAAPKPKKEDKKPMEFEAAPSCPACKTEEDYIKELDLIKEKNKPQPAPELAVAKKGKRATDPMASFGASFVTAGERNVKRQLLISFYQEQYARLGSSSVDLSKYTQDGVDANGLAIKNGHQPMARPPEGSVKLPADYKEPLGSITPEQLLRYDCFSPRMLICVHGDLFDVSDRPDKYSKDGPYWAMVGHDITWGLVSADDREAEYDKYYDIFKVEPEDQMERQLMGLMSWWAFYHKEYGDPVGRLDCYDREWQLPKPPDIGDNCCVM